MDGLLLDSERLARLAFEDACAELDIHIEPAVYERCIGSSWEATRTLLTEVLGSEDVYTELDRVWDRSYRMRIDAGQLGLKPGARALLRALETAGIPRAVATSTRRPMATAKLTRTGILPFFACLICGGETARGKPHPDPYLAAVAALRTPPAETWALEDSENGVRSARAAGLTVIQVPDLVDPSEELRGLGHRVVDDLFAVQALLAG